MKLAPTIAALMVSGLAAKAGIFTFSATLDGLQEVPPNASPAVGTASGIFDSVTSVFSIGGTFGGLTAPASAAHVHGGVVGVAGPVIFPLSVTPGTAGVISGISAPLTLAQISHLKNGDWYVNIHDSAFPGGEIRGQILLVSVPEPETYAALAGVGLLGFAAWRRIKA